jgi:pilus assembly protein CpaF
MSTLHANGPEEVPARFEALGALAGMPRDAVHAQLREALRVVVHVSRRGGSRSVDRVGVVVADPADPRVVRVVEAARGGEVGLVAGPGRDRLVQLVPGVATGCRWVGAC